MDLWNRIRRPPWRTLLLLLAVLGAIGLAYLAWAPGALVRDGRHDLRTNGIWIQHGWLGDDAWFQRNARDKTKFRDAARIQELADLLAEHGIRFVFPHLCPTDPGGGIAPVDPAQAELFLDRFEGFSVMPWIGGVLDRHAFPESAGWRKSFIASVVGLLAAHPRLSGVHLNIEPMPTGNPDFLGLLDELRQALPPGKRISVAAYPPPTELHPFPDVHWERAYFQEVARRVDQLAPMMYDTGVRWPKAYQKLMSDWTLEVLDWSGSTQVLLGLPAYDDAGVPYHDPEVENLPNSLLGIHAGLNRLGSLPRNYAGVALYCDWEMDPGEWSDFRREFERPPARR